MNRFYWSAQHDKRKLKLAALCQFTLVGPPIVYNGSEVGVRQERGMHEPHSQGMEENRQPMLWAEAQDAEIRDYFRWLIQLRQEHPVLGHGRFSIIRSDKQTLVYARSSDTEIVWVALNASDDVREVTAVTDQHQYSFTLQPWSGNIHCLTGQPDSL
jgi:glycosidase